MAREIKAKLSTPKVSILDNFVLTVDMHSSHIKVFGMLKTDIINDDTGKVMSSQREVAIHFRKEEFQTALERLFPDWSTLAATVQDIIEENPNGRG